MSRVARFAYGTTSNPDLPISFSKQEIKVPDSLMMILQYSFKRRLWKVDDSIILRRCHFSPDSKKQKVYFNNSISCLLCRRHSWIYKVRLNKTLSFFWRNKAHDLRSIDSAKFTVYFTTSAQANFYRHRFSSCLINYQCKKIAYRADESKTTSHLANVFLHIETGFTEQRLALRRFSPFFFVFLHFARAGISIYAFNLKSRN